MPLCPVLAGRIAPAMTQQESEQLLTSAHQVHRSIDSCPDQVAKRFVCSVWHPHWRQISRAVENRQLLRVAPVGLNPLSWLPWDHRRCSHGALMSQPCQLAMDPVSTPARFIAKVELAMPRKLLRHLVHGFRRVRDHADKPYRSAPTVFCNADGNGRLVDVHA